MDDALDTRDTVTIERWELMQIAQMVHQACHAHIGGNWRECPVGVCDRIRSLLGLPDRVPGATS